MSSDNFGIEFEENVLITKPFGWKVKPLEIVEVVVVWKFLNEGRLTLPPNDEHPPNDGSKPVEGKIE